MTPANHGDSYDRLVDAVRFSERNRSRVDALTDAVRRRVEAQEWAELTRRHKHARMDPPTSADLDRVVDERISRNPEWQAAVQNEQWGARLATMYAGVRAAELLVDLNLEAHRISALLHRSNSLLERLCDLLTPSTEEDDAT